MHGPMTVTILAQDPLYLSLTEDVPGGGDPASQAL